MHILLYIPWLIKEIIVSGVHLIVRGLTPGNPMRPVIVAYPLRITSAWQVFWFTSSITMTPSTLSLGLREPEHPGGPYLLLVHAVFGEDPTEVCASLADMEARLAPHVRTIDHGAPGQGPDGEDRTLAPRYWAHPPYAVLPRREDRADEDQARAHDHAKEEK